ncbi:MAG TPA: hypothetical protein VMU83_24975 [Hanamia sp.]|nr:hypothetical protein [Hanamia sp.]
MSHFIYHNLSLCNGMKWEVAKANIDFNNALYEKAVSQAKMKSQFTMDASQAGKYRSPELKYQMRLMGILAEIFAQEYLMEIISNVNLPEHWKVIRYDDVITDGFKSAANEYNIKIQSENESKEYKVESRSSIARDRSLKKAIEHFDIIGPYSSLAKPGESFVDFFIRPLYEFIPFASQIYLPGNFEKHLQSGEIKLHLVAGCTKKEMIEKGYKKSMKQNGTLYRVVKIVSGFDVNKFNKVLIEELK